MRAHPSASDRPAMAAGMSISLPKGAALAPGEKPLIGERFMLGTIVFYLHTQLVLTNRRLYATRPNTLFGLIPAGTSRRNFPVTSIAGVSASTRLNIVALLLGGLAIMGGFSALSTSPNTGGGIGLIIIGALLLLAVPRQAIEVMNSGGGVISFPVSVFERGKTVDFANRVSEALARGSGADQPIVPPDRDPDAGEALRSLTRLRDDGLITEDEFSAKRADILARL